MASSESLSMASSIAAPWLHWTFSSMASFHGSPMASSNVSSMASSKAPSMASSLTSSMTNHGFVYAPWLHRTFSSMATSMASSMATAWLHPWTMASLELRPHDLFHMSWLHRKFDFGTPVGAVTPSDFRLQGFVHASRRYRKVKSKFQDILKAARRMLDSGL